jgi:phosphoribosylanthranilate isomerase
MALSTVARVVQAKAPNLRVRIQGPPAMNKIRTPPPSTRLVSYIRPMTKVKICGITNLEDARAAVWFGADAVGFLVGQVHYSTSRFLAPAQVAEIVAGLPPFCSAVVVTHLSRPEEIIPVLKVANVTTLQLHGDTTPQEAVEVKKQLPFLKAYKVVHVFDASTIEEAKRYIGFVDGIILDTAIKTTGQVGGTGQTHDWRVSQEVVRSTTLPVILAGGLNPENIVEAIGVVQPYGVDVNSGVSNPDGTKDLQKLREFIARAKYGTLER